MRACPNVRVMEKEFCNYCADDTHEIRVKKGLNDTAAINNTIVVAAVSE